MNDTESIMSGLAGALGLKEPPRWEVDLAEDRPSRAALEEMVESGPTENAARLVTSLAALRDSYAEAKKKVGRDVTDKLAFWEKRLAYAHRRDELQLARRSLGPAYAECWCLGLGGKRPYRMAIRSRAIEGGIGGILPEGMTEADLMVFEQACSCPDGRREAARAAAVRSRVAEAFWGATRGKLAEQAAIPRRYTGLTLDTWAVKAQAHGAAREDTDRIVAVIEGWYGAIRTGWNPEDTDPTTGEMIPPPCATLVLAGDFGTGKSGLAAAVAQRFLDDGQAVLYRTVPDLLDGARAAYDDPEAARRSLIERVRDVTLLVLDDLGAEKLTETNEDWVIETLYRILDYRVANVRATIVTTNQSSAALKERIGERLYQRIVPDSVSAKAVVTTPDLRADA